MAYRAIYFVVGTFCGIAIYLAGNIFEVVSEHCQSTAEDARLASSSYHAVWQNINLVGTWKGKESWGITYKITRSAGGKFHELMDLRKGDAFWSKGPSFLDFSGRWSLVENQYAYYELDEKEPGKSGSLITYRIRPEATDEFEYMVGEGNGAYEIRPSAKSSN